MRAALYPTPHPHATSPTTPVVTARRTVRLPGVIRRSARLWRRPTYRQGIRPKKPPCSNLRRNGQSEHGAGGNPVQELGFGVWDKAIAIATSRLQESGINPCRLALHEVEHRLDHPRRGEHLPWSATRCFDFTRLMSKGGRDVGSGGWRFASQAPRTIRWRADQRGRLRCRHGTWQRIAVTHSVYEVGRVP